MLCYYWSDQTIHSGNYFILIVTWHKLLYDIDFFLKIGMDTSYAHTHIIVVYKILILEFLFHKRYARTDTLLTLKRNWS